MTNTMLHMTTKKHLARRLGSRLTAASMHAGLPATERAYFHNCETFVLDLNEITEQHDVQRPLSTLFELYESLITSKPGAVNLPFPAIRVILLNSHRLEIGTPFESYRSASVFFIRQDIDNGEKSTLTYPVVFSEPYGRQQRVSTSLTDSTTHVVSWDSAAELASRSETMDEHISTAVNTGHTVAKMLIALLAIRNTYRGRLLSSGERREGSSGSKEERALGTGNYTYVTAPLYGHATGEPGETASHLRRGHLRKQWYGPRGAEHAHERFQEVIWIDPVIVNRERAEAGEVEKKEREAYVA